MRPYVDHCERCMAAFLQGVGERGWERKDKKHFGHISIVNTDRQLMEYALSLLKALGIFARLYKRRKRETENIKGGALRRRRQFIYLLKIQKRPDILRFREVAGFAIKRKQEVLDKLYRRAIV